MILAGEEFADANMLFDADGNGTDASGKEIDPVHFALLEGNSMRQAILTYVAGLVSVRTTQPALSVNDTRAFSIFM
jgi:hypothetical protein